MQGAAIYQRKAIAQTPVSLLVNKLAGSIGTLIAVQTAKCMYLGSLAYARTTDLTGFIGGNVWG